jgi:hypothetical protein
MQGTNVKKKILSGIYNSNYSYFIKIYNKQYIILSFYNNENAVNFNYNLYI